MGKSRIFNEKGDILIREGWEAGTSAKDVLAQVNAVLSRDEKPYTINVLLHRVRMLQLYRPSWYMSARGREAGKQSAKTGKLKGVSKPKSVQALHRTGDMQHPLNDPIKLLPQTRGSDLSRARFEIISEMKEWAVVRCDRQSVLEWGRQWSESEDLAAINAARKKYHLPLFEIA